MKVVLYLHCAQESPLTECCSVVRECKTCVIFIGSNTETNMGSSGIRRGLASMAKGLCQNKLSCTTPFDSTCNQG